MKAGYEIDHFTDCEQILSHKLCHVINEFYGTGPW